MSERLSEKQVEVFRILAAGSSDTARIVRILLADRDAHLADLKDARRLLWLYHGHFGLYGDDGEMQCQGTDFKRDPLSSLEDHLDPEGAEMRSALMERTK